MGAVEGQPIVSANEWEQVKKEGDQAIKDWIESKMKDKECLVVLVGKQTAGRRWVKHEIKRACERGIGVLGIYIHGLKNEGGDQAEKGADPFAGLVVDGKSVAAYAKMYDPPYKISTNVYDYIANNIEAWGEAAIDARK